jgi:hypothetical protein
MEEGPMRGERRPLWRGAGYGALYVLAIAAGIAIGYLYNRLSGHVELAIVFPALAGAAGGAVVRLATGAARLPATRAVLLAGLLAGGLAYASSFYFDYREFRADLARVGNTSVTLQAAQVDQMEAQLLGAPGFISYLNARAQYGSAQGWLLGGAAPISGQMVWLLWAGEITLAAAAGGYVLSVRQRGSAVHAATSATAPEPQGNAQRYGSGKWSNWSSRSI